MFPFDYIPKSIDPKIRKMLIGLISVQFIAFLILIIILIYEHCSIKFAKKSEKKEDEKNKKEKKEETKTKEDNKIKNE